jgi:hypothetical protein
MPDQPEPTRGPGRPSNETLIAESMKGIAAVLGQLQQQAPKKEITFGDTEFQDRLRADGHFKALETPAFQNGREIEPRILSDETIHRLPRLAPGKYIKGHVEVAVDARNRRHLIYKSSTPEDRMRGQSLWRDLDDMVAQIWADMPKAATV